MSARDPGEIYQQRLGERRRSLAQRRAQERVLATLRLALFAVGAVLLGFALFSEGVHWAWLLLPGVAFVGVALGHDRVIRARRRADRAVGFYESGLARLEHRSSGSGTPGTEFLTPEHPYAGDLDLFGPGSLFELLCTARTRTGERRLAEWLGAPAAPAEIRARQEAVAELRGRIDLREDLAVLGAEVGQAVDADRLVAWSTAPAELAARWPRLLAPLLGLANFAGLGAYLAGHPIWLVPCLLASGAFVTLFHTRARRVLSAVDRPERDLQLLSELLERIENESYRAPRLVALRETLDADGAPPSRSIARLVRLAELQDSRRNMLFAPLAALGLLGTWLAFALEVWRREHGRSVVLWVTALGDFEALSALANYAFEHPADPFPELVDEGALFAGEGLGHPLLPTAKMIRNDVRLGDGLQLLLVSGSNMSGKSTLLRTVGVNVVLALAGAPVRAHGLRLSPVSVGACMRVQDSLQQGMSHFYAEISRLRSIVDLCDGALPVLFLLDEILHGTNSHDRGVGAEALIRGLLERGAVGLVTTHDLALTRIAEELAPRATNVHFADHIEDGKMVFDYALQPGVVRKSNALALMRAVGLEV